MVLWALEDRCAGRAEAGRLRTFYTYRNVSGSPPQDVEVWGAGKQGSREVQARKWPKDAGDGQAVATVGLGTGSLAPVCGWFDLVGTLVRE